MNQTLTQIQEEELKKFDDLLFDYGYETFNENGDTAKGLVAKENLKSFLTQSNLRVIEKVKQVVEEEISELEAWAKVTKSKQDVKEYKFAVFVLKKVLSTLIKQK